MELTLLFVNPLPTRLSGGEAVKFVSNVLKPLLSRWLVAISAAAEDHALAWAFSFNSELYDLIDSSTFLATEGDFILPESHWLKLKVFSINLLKGLDRRLHLPLKLEKNVPAEAFAKLAKLLD